ncbi:GIY-YIG nuclease family protein [Telmatospirillum sp. J64-1]|uniref:GIY-YIG nuclease family protein n=1 Tax=Telmatospirillum sp. J64-1 TaxID=2502183 RepID=UPI0021067284|nr:GIY-YIG nuclease family protein [Telmatospirillum sp. J64-1]
MMRPWYLYVLLNGKGEAYTGISPDPEERLNRHNNGTGARFTRGRGPWALVYCEGPFDGKGPAQQREYQVRRDRLLKQQLKGKT